MPAVFNLHVTTILEILKKAIPTGLPFYSLLNAYKPDILKRITTYLVGINDTEREHQMAKRIYGIALVSHRYGALVVGMIVEHDTVSPFACKRYRTGNAIIIKYHDLVTVRLRRLKNSTALLDGACLVSINYSFGIRKKYHRTLEMNILGTKRNKETDEYH